VSLVHYNTLAEVGRFAGVLAEVVAQLRSTQGQHARVSTA
jgi:hypothetical protein